MVYTVTFNPSLDYVVASPALSAKKFGETHRKSG